MINKMQFIKILNAGDKPELDDVDFSDFTAYDIKCIEETIARVNDDMQYRIDSLQGKIQSNKDYFLNLTGRSVAKSKLLVHNTSLERM